MTASQRANGFLSAVLCLMMFLFTCAFALLLALRAGNVATIIRNTDFLEILDGTEFSHYIVHQLNGLPFHDAEISFSDVEDFIKSDAVSGEIGGLVDGYARAFAEGNLYYHITSDDILGIVRNLEPEFNDLFDHNLTEAEIENFARTLDDILDLSGLSVGDLLYELEINTTVPYLIISSYLLWGAGILCATTLIVTFIHHRRRVSDAFIYAGIPIMLSGLLCLTVGVIFISYPEILGDTLHGIARITGGLAYLVRRYGIILTTTGIVFIAVHILVKPVKIN